MSELTPQLLRRVLVATEFEYCEDLFWREDGGDLRMFAKCSDFFDWGCADAEPIETEQDVELLERCLADLRQATGKPYPLWLTYLYASRRRNQPPAPMMFEGKYAMEPEVQGLFRGLGMNA